MANATYIGPYSAETYDKMYGTGALFNFPAVASAPTSIVPASPAPVSTAPKKGIDIMYLAIGFVALVIIIFLILKFK